MLIFNQIVWKMGYDELISVSHGAKTAGTLALILVGIVLVVGLGSFRLVAATLLCLLVGLSFTALFATLVIGYLNLISVTFAVLYIGLGVDYAIHLCLRYRELINKGEPPMSAPSRTVRDVGGSLMLCAVTTATGFYCFVPTDYTGVSELGIISGTGMFISLAVTLTLLPALLCLWMRNAPTPASPGRAAAWFTSLCQHFGQYQRSIRISTLVLGLGSLFLLPQMRFDYNPINLRDQHSESVRTYKDLVSRHNISPSSIMVMVGNARKARAMEQRLGKLQSVEKAISIFDFIPQRQDAKLGLIDDMALILGLNITGNKAPPPTASEQMASMRKLDRSLIEYLSTVPAKNRGAFQALHDTLRAFIGKIRAQKEPVRIPTLAKLKDSLLATLPATLSFLRTALQTQAVSESSIPESLRRRWVSPNGIYRIEVTPKEDIGNIHALRRFVAQVRTIAPDATGAPVFTLEAGDTVIHAFKQAFALALALIVLLLLALSRSIKNTCLVLLPLLLAGSLTIATAVLLGIRFNFANVIALPLLLGIGVDNGIHMVQRFRHMQRSGKGSHQLLATSTSQAVMFSSLTTICGFGNLAFSSHQGTASMGRMLTLGIGFAMLCSLLVLPAFLNIFTARSLSDAGQS